MGYLLKLSFRYIRKNPARTAYSVLGICLTAIMCFGLMTAFYSAWDYSCLAEYRQFPYELSVPFGEENWTREMVRAALAMQKDEAVKELTIRLRDPYSGRGSRTVLPVQMKAGENYALWIKLNETKALQASADALAEKYHFDVRVNSAAAFYYRQDDSGSMAMLNLMLSLALMIFGSFFVAIIRNTMLIAVTERVRDHGLLRCVGMSEGQLRILLSAEGLLMSLAASFLGIMLGYSGMWLLEPWIRETLGLEAFFHFGFYPVAVICTTILVAGVTLFALIEPSRQAGALSPLDALHGIYSSTQKRKKKKLPSGGWEEKLFGAAGFYARRNYKRGRGHQWAVFTAMFFSMAFLLTVLAFCNTFTATTKKQMKLDSEGSSLYREALSRTGGTGPAWAGSVIEQGDIENLKKELEAREDVTDTVTVAYAVNSARGSGLVLEDPKLRSLLKDKTVNIIYELAYDREGFEMEKEYLLEGSADHDELLEKKGILICDMAADGKRHTDYKCGDTIKMLTPDAAAEALKKYCAALAVVSGKHDMPAWSDYSGQYVYFENGEEKRMRPDPGNRSECLAYRGKNGVEDTEFTELKEDILDALSAQGTDLDRAELADSISILDILHALESAELEAGGYESFEICGILSDDFYMRVGDHENPAGRLNGLRIIYPMETAAGLIEASREASEAAGFPQPEKGMYLNGIQVFAFGRGCNIQIGIRRDMELLDPGIRKLAAKLSGWEYYNRLWDTSGDGYFEAVQQMKVLRLVVMLLGGFIMTICLVQVINTLQANIRLRRKELWLYDVVGMSPAQRFKMQLMEHGMSAIAGMGLGMLASFVFSYVYIEKLLDWSGSGFEYRWPWSVALIMTAAVCGILFLVNHVELKRSAVYR